jgi:hypothetical protein
MSSDGCFYQSLFLSSFVLSESWSDLDWGCLPENLRSQGCERGAYMDVFTAIFRQAAPVQVTVPDATIELFHYLSI